MNRLQDRNPTVSVSQMLAEFVPPREFAKSTFENYVPAEAFPSQSETRDFLSRSPWTSIDKKSPAVPGIYLDGGFGVGKTHLLAALFHATRGKKLFGSFLAYTGLIGAIGFAEAMKLFRKYDFIAIDEFELDDPGNTMIMSRLINDLSGAGVKFAATSNTPPDALGAGRFAAEDFQREILGIGGSFLVLTIDGEDFRHRHSDEQIGYHDDEFLAKWIAAGELRTLDGFDQLLKHLATLHPSKFHRLLEGLDGVAIADVHALADQADALRFVAFVDRLYEAQVPVANSGISFSNIFPADMLGGGYQKKYRRALSRLGSLAQ